jgi:hypothetical protein
MLGPQGGVVEGKNSFAAQFRFLTVANHRTTWQLSELAEPTDSALFFMLSLPKRADSSPD